MGALGEHKSQPKLNKVPIVTAFTYQTAFKKTNVVPWSEGAVYIFNINMV